MKTQIFGPTKNGSKTNKQTTNKKNSLASKNGQRTLKGGIIGAGVVGEATARLLKYLGCEVYLNDIKDISHFEEEGFHVRSDYRINETDFTMLVLPTPTVRAGLGGRTDLRVLEDVTENLGRQLKDHNQYHRFVIRSTVPPGTTRELGERLGTISGKEIGRDYGMCMIPEFLRAHSANEDALKPSVTVIGASDGKSAKPFVKLYGNLNAPIQIGTLEEAEMLKYIHNIANATKISFWNEVNDICKIFGVDFRKVAETVTQTAESMTRPAYGTKGGWPYGGTCLPKDSQSMFRELRRRGYTPRVLEAVIKVNDEMNGRVEKFVRSNGVYQDGLDVQAAESLLNENDHATFDNLRILRGAR